VDAKADTAMGGVWKKGPGLGLFKSLNDVSQPFASPTPHICLHPVAGLPVTPTCTFKSQQHIQRASLNIKGRTLQIGCLHAQHVCL